MQKFFILQMTFFNVIFFFFWSISHAPSKKNNSIKKSETRKWSTILLTATVFLTILYIGQPALAVTGVLFIVSAHVTFSKIIKEL